MVAIEYYPTFDQFDAFKAMDPEIRKRREIQDLVIASDINRQAIADGSIETDIPQNESTSKTVFWRLHQTYFRRNPYRALNADSSAEQIYTRIHTFHPAKLKPQIGRVRTTNFTINDFPLIHADHLETVQDNFFSAIEAFISQYNSQEIRNPQDVYSFLARVEVIQTLCHFPVEASGRTIEDFMVYVAHKCGISLTFSRSGYRGFIDNDFIQRSNEIRNDIRNFTTAYMYKQYTTWLVPPESLPETLPPIFHMMKKMEYKDAVNLFVSNLFPYIKCPEEQMHQLAMDYQTTLINRLVQTLPDTQHGNISPEWEYFNDPVEKFVGLLEEAESREYLTNVSPLVILPLVHRLYSERAKDEGTYLHATIRYENAENLIKKIRKLKEKRGKLNHATKKILDLVSA